MIKKLREYINGAKNIIAFTGAGISVESGIPDFRSSGGLYTSGDYEGYDPESILSRKMFRTNPKLVLKFYKERLFRMVDKVPNRSHIALKKLEDNCKLKNKGFGIITQNIDNLHRKAGNENILELHGNSTKFVCSINCGNTYTYEDFCRMIEDNPLPMCKCEMAPIRPNVVLFDEWLDDGIFDNAFWASQRCDLMIAIGSSLNVRPACGLLDEISPTCKLVIINKDITPYDNKSNLIIRQNCGEILEQLSYE